MEEQSAPEPSAHPDHIGPNIDPVLGDLLNDMEALGYSLDLTLTVQGSLISGVPVFMAEYLKKQGALIERSGRENARRQRDPEAAEAQRVMLEAIGQRMARNADQYERPKAPEGDAEAKDRLSEWQDRVLTTPREHVILKRAVIVTPDGGQSNIPFWRGRLAHVAGWCYGTADGREYIGPDPDDLE